VSRRPFLPDRDAAPTFELTRDLRVPRADVHAFLCDLRGYVPLHPFIESIEDLPAIPDLPAARVYRVVDKIPLGPFKLKTVYDAALEPRGDDEVRGHAWQSPNVRLHTRYGLRDVADGTRLVERCFVDAPGGLRRFVASQARKAHDETLDGLKALLEGTRADASGDPT